MTTVLWIAVIALLLTVGVLLWRSMTATRDMPVGAPAAPPPEPPRDVSQRPAPSRSAAPPPAMAGPLPDGFGGPGVPPSTPRPRAGTPPPPVAAGPRAGAAPDGAATRPARTSPPPAAAGPGAARAGESAERRRPTARPPAPAAPSPADAAGETGRATVPQAANPLLSITSWGYQLQKLDLERAAASPFEVLVIDYSRDGSDERALRPAEIERLKRRPDRGRRLVLAYLSAGEAESYRYYWKASWRAEPPAWLLSENPKWRENFAVCFWDPRWQRLMCGHADSYLDKILAAGFDGVYLDKCDVFEDLERREKKVARTRPDIEADMVTFVVHLSRYAKSKAPGFLVVMQNAENLLEHEALRASIDGVAKEELLFGLNGSERKNPKGEIEDARRALDKARRAGKAVLMVEYLNDAAKAAEAARYAEEAGYVLYVAPKDRELDRLNYDVLEA